MKPTPKRGRGRKWLGGYVHHEADGSELFIIEKQVGGRRFHLSTRCNDEESALEHLQRFRANPLGYDPAGLAPDVPVVITNELLLEFLDFQINEKGNTTKHARSAVRFLGEWMEVLGAKDVRALSVTDDLKPALKRWKTSRQHRIIALKSFFSWLRTEKGLVRHAEDATLDLKVPQSTPEKHRRRKVADPDAVLDVFRRLSKDDQDVLQVFCATGWHITEVARLARDPRSTIEIPRVDMRTKHGQRVLGVLSVWHKTKQWTRTSIVHAPQLEAARRLRERGFFVNETRLRKAIYAALEAADRERREIDPQHQDRPRFTPGEMRHTVATWGIDLGATVEEAATHLNHADAKTTKRFYADVMVPRPEIPTRVLN